MGTVETSRVGKRGAIVIPARLRRRFGIEEGDFVIAEEREEGILIRRAEIKPVEVYTPERKAEFLLNNVVDAADYAAAVEEVRKMGLDPKQIPHDKPPGA
jgi:AbrB family looped-hinge helix DNA binding protein